MVVNAAHGQHAGCLRRGQQLLGPTVARSRGHQHPTLRQGIGRTADGVLLPGFGKITAHADVDHAHIVPLPVVIAQQPLQPSQDVFFRDAPAAAPDLDRQQSRPRRIAAKTALAEQAVARGDGHCHLSVPAIARAVPQAWLPQPDALAVVGQVHIFDQAHRHGFQQQPPLLFGKLLPGGRRALPGGQAGKIGMWVIAAVQEGDGGPAAVKGGVGGQPSVLSQHALFGRVIVGKGRAWFGQRVQAAAAALRGIEIGKAQQAVRAESIRRAPGRCAARGKGGDGWVELSVQRQDTRVAGCAADWAGRQRHRLLALRLTSSQSTPKPKPSAPAFGLRNSSVRSNSWRSSSRAWSPSPCVISTTM